MECSRCILVTCLFFCIKLQDLDCLWNFLIPQELKNQVYIRNEVYHELNNTTTYLKGQAYLVAHKTVKLNELDKQKKESKPEDGTI